MASAKRSRKKTDRRSPSPGEPVRLQKYLAECGLGSRRACEDIIASGRVTVDGERIDTQGYKVIPGKQVVCVDGKEASLEQKLYLALHKPRNVICTSSDPEGRATFLDLLPDLPSRVYSVGRLDWDSEGLLLITNDGEFTDTITHPRNEVPKIYRVWLDGELQPRQIDQILKGVTVDSDLLRAISLQRLKPDAGVVRYDVEIREGRNRHLRRMFEAVGRKVSRLKRMRIGSLELGRLPVGQWRYLAEEEIESLMRELNHGSGQRSAR